MTCRQLGGACDLEFHAETFEEMAKMSQDHGRKMYQKGDIDHLRAMEKINQMMQDPTIMQQWMDAKRKEFDALPQA